jgi:transposase-like protein
MTKEEIKASLLSLTQEERETLLAEIEASPDMHTSLLGKRREHFDNKIGRCPHCGSNKYRKHGIDKGSQRYYCNGCKRTFTEYTGTWICGLHKKELVVPYLKHMEKEDSLDEINACLKINKKTALDWRHKVLTALDLTDQGNFKGITESDETFFLTSEKGKQQKERQPRKRGGKATKRGISDEQVAVIVTLDRESELDMTLATLGRIKKVDIEAAIGKMVSNETILCSDSHRSYKGFAKDKQLEHHTLLANMKEHSRGRYHIQHVNSIDNKLKKWIEYQFWGVSTKYLQKYLNWFKTKEPLKESKDFLKEFAGRTLQDTSTRERFCKINEIYMDLICNAKLN